MKRVKAIVVEYNDGIETGHRKYKSVEKAWTDAETKNTTDPACISKHRFYKVVEVKRKRDTMDSIV